MKDSEYLQNVDLDGDPFTYQGSSTGILLIHGFTATTTEVRLLADRLRPSGITIMAPLLPGHGTSPGDLNRRKYFEWITEVEKSYNALAVKCDRVFVAGESTGALLSLYLAAKHSEIAGVICYSPALIINFIWLSVILQYFIPSIPKSGPEDDLPWKGYKVNPTKATYQLFHLQRSVKTILSAIKQPVCIFIGGKDRRVSAASGDYLMQHLGTVDKEIHYMANSPHCMILANELPEISSLTESFIQRHQKVQPSA